ncbi:membrane protein YoeI [Shigella flexneri]|nr:membrane protein YoeI [Shigella flexneri]EFC0401873.1 membrane protein YoeI [Escherichia coli]EFR0852722.1 membrane protein YoeI [Shigella sonnei]HAY5781991.1 membrane protein YoeI [Shigella flexneri 3b]HAY9074960.1 membrane protein YoeI [Shigella boydii]AUU33551.1 membrane protein YoeI [Shigella flexneri]
MRNPKKWGKFFAYATVITVKENNHVA